MLSQEEQIALFVKSIDENAQKICKKIDKDAKKLYATEISKIQSSVKDEVQKKIEYAKEEVETSFNKELALAKSNARRMLCDKRQEITDCVFEEIKNQLLQFTLTDDYISFVEKSFDKITSYIQNDFIVYVKSSDEKKVKAVTEKMSLKCEIKTDDAISIGGIRVESLQCSKIFDDTLDCRLEEQKSWFYSNSNLSVNI